MYGVIMADIVDSSLMAEGGKVTCWVFSMMVAHADKDHCLRKDPRTFAKQIDCTQEEFERAISILTKPDPHSNIPDSDGRRVIPLSELPEKEGNRGWFIVNREHYINKIKVHSGSKQRVIKHRKKEKILSIINELQERNVTVTLSNAALSIYISISISIDIFKTLIEKGVDLELWARYEDYRREIGKPLKTDKGRLRQINVLIGHPSDTQSEIIQHTIDHEWIKLIPLSEIRASTKRKTATTSTGRFDPKDEASVMDAAKKLGLKAKPGETMQLFTRRVMQAMRGDDEN